MIHPLKWVAAQHRLIFLRRLLRNGVWRRKGTNALGKKKIVKAIGRTVQHQDRVKWRTSLYRNESTTQTESINKSEGLLAAIEVLFTPDWDQCRSWGGPSTQILLSSTSFNPSNAAVESQTWLRFMYFYFFIVDKLVCFVWSEQILAALFVRAVCSLFLLCGVDQCDHIHLCLAH